MEKKEILLSTLIPLERLTPEDREALLSSLVEKTFEKNAVIKDKKVSPSGVLFLTSGLIRVYTDKEGRGETLLFHVFPGQATTFSAPRIVSDFSIDYKMQAVSDSSCLIIPDEIFITLEKKYTEIGNNVNKLLAKRTEGLLKSLELLLSESLPERIQLYLEKLSSNLGTKEIPITQEMMARDIGCSRERLCRILSKMRKEGKIETSRSLVKLL